MTEAAEAFYKKFFTETGDFARRYPNHDEVVRLERILSLVTRVAGKYDRPLTILDMGCGRGWLSYILSLYGEVTGVEPVASVVEHAKQTYADVKFVAGSTGTLLEAGYEKHFDLIVSSEVIEHVPRSQQQQFVAELSKLLRDGGDLVMTSPRGEMYAHWFAQPKAIPQPVEDWLSEAELADLIESSEMAVVEQGRFRTLAAALQKNWSDRLWLKLARTTGLQNSEPQALTIYQWIWAQKRSRATPT